MRASRDRTDGTESAKSNSTLLTHALSDMKMKADTALGITAEHWSENHLDLDVWSDQQSGLETATRMLWTYQYLHEASTLHFVPGSGL